MSDKSVAFHVRYTFMLDMSFSISTRTYGYKFVQIESLYNAARFIIDDGFRKDINDQLKEDFREGEHSASS